MKILVKTLLISLIAIFNLSCSNPKSEDFKAKELYKSDDLLVTQIAENAFIHTSFLQTDDFGKVPCNGLIVRDNKETIIFDTPTNDKSSTELINWIEKKLNSKINAIIPTHFHNDCLGGLQAFHDHQIPSYANFKTIELAKANDFVVPKNSFKDSLNLKVGKEKIIAKFLGEGHTKDNVVGYFPSENVMFGGCLVKELNATKGYLGDANVADWSATVQKVKAAFPNVKTVVPGHGVIGDKSLLDYTAKLFQNQ
jgi:metallo-beta-lactamase class B